MIRGVKKSVIVVDPPKKSSFEKIFFVMKSRQAPSGAQDMIAEANRIIGESLMARSGRGAENDKGKRWAAFGVGIVIGAILGMLGALLVK